MERNFSETDHHAKLGVYVEYLWNKKDLTDVMIVVENKEFKAHKTVLACYSSYFKEVLWKPGANNVHYLEVPCITAKAFEILLYYMYTGEMKLTCQDIANVYLASRKLGMKDALNICLELLTVSAGHIENAINLYVTSKKLYLTEQADKAFLLMTKHFETLALSQQFLDMTEDQIVEYLSDDGLVVRSEIVVFLAALKWINYRFLERELSISKVMGAVRFSNMALEEIIHCYHPPILPAIVMYPTVKLALYRSTAYLSSKELSQETLFGEFAQPPRKFQQEGEPLILWCALENDYEEDSLYIIGGIDAKKTYSDTCCCGPLKLDEVQNEVDDAICRFHPNCGDTDWKELAAIHDLRHNIKMVSYNNVIYCVGGCAPKDFDGRKMIPKPDCYRYNLKTKRWIPMASMSTARAFHGLLVLNGRIWAIGGKNEEGIIQSSCERYDPVTNSWENTEGMSSPKMAMGACAYKNMVWIAGGLTGVNTEQMVVVADTLVLGINLFNWTKKKDLPIPLCLAELVTADGKLFCIGGSTNYSTNNADMNSVSTIYQYSLKADNWLKFVDMPTPLHAPVSLGLGINVFIVGGYSSVEKCMIKDVLYLDCENKAWVSSPLPIPTIQYAIAVTAVSGSIV